MFAVTDAQIRASLVNCSRREAGQATLPDLTDVRWDAIDILGWTDRKYPKRAYLLTVVDGELAGVMLRLSGATTRRSAMCTLCEDVTATEDVAMLVARQGGAAGRNGDTVGTLVHTDFSCSKHVRRMPTRVEAGDDPETYTARRIDGLRERAARFVRGVRDEG